MPLCTASLLSCTLMLTPVVAKHDLDWQIASDLSGQATPNILSELEYQKVRSQGLGVGVELDYQPSTETPWLLSWALNYQGSHLSDGRFTDSDYSDDNRTGLFSRSTGAVDDGSFLQLSAEMGLHYQLAPKHRLGVVGGVERSDLKVVMTDGVQTVPAIGAFSGLRSSYDSQWRSTLAGAEYRYQMAGWGALSVRYSILRGEFEAEADWNLRTDFKHPTSFAQWAYSQGELIDIRYSGPAINNFNWYLAYQWRELDTDPGLDRTYRSDGSVVDTRLNEVNWKSQSLTLGLGWRF